MRSDKASGLGDGSGVAFYGSRVLPLDTALIAWRALRVARLRTFLTLLGVAIGVASVVGVTAINEALLRHLSDHILGLGGATFAIQKQPLVIRSQRDWWEISGRREIDWDAAAAVRAGCTACAEVGMQVDSVGRVRWHRFEQSDVHIVGSTGNMRRIGRVRHLTAGRHLSEQDVIQGRSVAVIGADLVDAFFTRTDPIGQSIMVGTGRFTVIGVVQRQGTAFGTSLDNELWVPITTYRKLVDPFSPIVIAIEASSPGLLERAKDECRIAMRAHRHLRYSQPDDFALDTGESVMTLFQSTTEKLYVTALALTGISILVAAIMVGNVMLVSVAERVREIGIRRSSGARRRDIWLQFLAESLLIVLAGNALGTVIAMAFAATATVVLGRQLATPFPVSVPAWAVGMAALSSAAVGLAAGLYPASRAAAQDPVRALRSE